MFELIELRGAPAWKRTRTGMCALLVGLPDVTVHGVGDWPRRLWIVVEALAYDLCGVVVGSCIVTGSVRLSLWMWRCSVVFGGASWLVSLYALSHIGTLRAFYFGRH